MFLKLLLRWLDEQGLGKKGAKTLSRVHAEQLCWTLGICRALRFVEMDFFGCSQLPSNQSPCLFMPFYPWALFHAMQGTCNFLNLLYFCPFPSAAELHSNCFPRILHSPEFKSQHWPQSLKYEAMVNTTLCSSQNWGSVEERCLYTRLVYPTDINCVFHLSDKGVSWF